MSTMHIFIYTYIPIGLHDDARTNIAIALTAAQYGASMLNYGQVVELLHNEEGIVKGAGKLSIDICIL